MERTNTNHQEPPLPTEIAAIMGSMPLSEAKVGRPHRARRRLLQQNWHKADIGVIPMHAELEGGCANRHQAPPVGPQLGWSSRPGLSAALYAGKPRMIHVLAIITAKPHRRDALLETFRANMPAVHAEAGCIEYGPAIDVTAADPDFGPDTFVVIEKWESMVALRAHAAARTCSHTPKGQEIWWPSVQCTC